MPATDAAVTTVKDRSIQEALLRVGPSPAEPEHEAQPARRAATVTAVHHLPARAARTVPFPDELDDRLRRALVARGVGELYTHQAAAFAHVRSDRHVVVVTPTASGKTLCYNAPVLSRILEDPSSRALYLFPTKALAQDQLAELHGLSQTIEQQSDESIAVFTYDGDTPQDARRAIRGRAHVVLSNPDMLHSGILPHHPRWAKLFENLRYVVIDELHAYRGVFGSHLANILRRLRRVCHHYGSDPVFICSSATIANPRELAERLTERAFELVDDNGAPNGEKVFVFANPPVVNQALGIRRSYLAESRRVALEFLRRKLQVIVFAQSRLATEILTTYLKDACPSEPGATEPIRGYRGGYLPLRRREIERGLRAGEVRGVVSTNALELGVDIGALDACILAGYPGTIAATWQRAGRAGRRSGRSAAVLVASSAPLDQFMVRNPEYFFGASPERALIDPDNLHVLLDHIKSAAFELPFGEDEAFGPDGLPGILGLLADEGFVHQSEGQWHWTHESYPADAVSLRSVSSDNFVVVDTTDAPQVIGEVDFTSAPSTLHEKAIYLVEGRLYQVERLDFENRKAYVEAVDCDYYTDAITYTKVTMLDLFDGGEVLPSDQGGEGAVASAARRSHGEVHVVSRVVGFKKIKFYTNENVGSGELELPEQQMHTSAYWMTLPGEVMAALPYPTDAKRDGVVGLAFAMRSVAQLLLMCDRHDIGVSIDGDGSETPTLGGAASSPPQLAPEPQIFIYDNYPRGIGFSEPLFGLHDELLARTRELIGGCPCPTGCPSCVGPAGDASEDAKAVASAILEALSIAP
ncbi:MAG: DEAD/DEAH box helicase [Vicinamibacterales bacterium]|jgi:DEAD/DEAH box helicase domain-containing protein|nr:helicase [Acidobacteriota bacterium]MDP6374201.1 DEAD/DEAH box helicase [Vicinamibacterales bacterium]MDP6608658.1 DEAD/DEAH box helicase [Vicinamibacterales bacterium]